MTSPPRASVFSWARWRQLSLTASISYKDEVRWSAYALCKSTSPKAPNKMEALKENNTKQHILLSVLSTCTLWVHFTKPPSHLPVRDDTTPIAMCTEMKYGNDSWVHEDAFLPKPIISWTSPLLVIYCAKRPYFLYRCGVFILLFFSDLYSSYANQGFQNNTD